MTMPIVSNIKTTKEGWFIQSNGLVKILQYDYGDNDYFVNMAKEIGNKFETEEEAKRVVEKLKAWKRLKDKGFVVESWDTDIGDNYYKTGQIVLNLNNVKNREWDEYTQINEIKNDLDLLFGGKE